ncbi:AAA family ATPase [Candidatus Babeliales bacterium]|nr:AAA family ATPase [Candidatus Babeliales bacterium]MCF7899627.1 AAA family ATPase [Candidatus Babeliales bacterium]
MINFFKKRIYIVFLLLTLIFNLNAKINKTNVIISVVTGGLIFGGVALLEEVERERKKELLVELNGNGDNGSSSGNNNFNPVSNNNKADNSTYNSNKDNKILLKDVVGQDYAVREVNEVIDFLKKPEKYKKLGAQIPRGVLMEGPPGNGKTLIARAVANEMGCNFIYTSASSFVEIYVGVGAKRVRELFNQARKNKPAIVFIDEIDAIGAASRGAGGNEEYRQTLNQILVEMDGFGSQDNIIIMAATNNADALDQALKRPGRFDRIIKVPNPDEKSRKEILEYYLNKKPRLEKDDTISTYLAKNSENFSGADLCNVVNEAAMLAVRANANMIKKEHLQEALQKEKEKKVNNNKSKFQNLLDKFN